jgi:ketosteroid isomerase-like protein
MKNFLKLTFISTFLILASCNAPINTNPNFEANVETAKKFMVAHGSDDIATQTELIHDDLLWQPPMYGSKQYGKAEHIEAMKMYQTMFDDILYTADNWLPGVNAETGELDGSVRTYGTWTGVSAETGQAFSLTAYHTMDFTDGKISAGGDYFDVGGFFASFEESAE